MSLVRKYFISTESLKKLSLIENNVEASTLAVMLNRVQKTSLEPVLGTPLYKKLLEDIDDDTLTGIYETLVNEYILDFLIVCCELEYVVSGANKFANMGVGKYSPQDTQTNNLGDNNDVRDNLKKHRQAYRDSLVGYLQDNEDDIPEYAEYNCQNKEEIAPQGKEQNPYFTIVTRKKFR